MAYFLQFKTKSNVDFATHGVARYARDPSTDITHLVVSDGENHYVWEKPEHFMGVSDYQKKFNFGILLDILTKGEDIYSWSLSFQKWIYEEKGRQWFKDLWGEKSPEIDYAKWHCLTEKSVLSGYSSHINKVPGEMGLFTDYPVKSKNFYIERLKENNLKSWTQEIRQVVNNYFKDEINILVQIQKELSISKEKTPVQKCFEICSAKTQKLNKEGIRINTDLCKKLFAVAGILKTKPWYFVPEHPWVHALEHIKNKISHGRMYNTMVFRGMKTGGWTTPGFPLHGLQKPTCTFDIATHTLNKVLRERDITENQAHAIKGLIRACLLPEEGEKFFVADLKEVQARIIYWLIDKQPVDNIYLDIAHQCGFEERDAAKLFFLSMAFGISQDTLLSKFVGNFSVPGMDQGKLNYSIALFNSKYPGIGGFYGKIKKAIENNRSGAGISFKIKVPCGYTLDYGLIKEEKIRTMHGFKKVYFDGDLKKMTSNRVFQNIVSSAATCYFQIKDALMPPNANLKWSEHDKVIYSTSENLDEIWKNSGNDLLQRVFKMTIPSVTDYRDTYYG